MTVQDLIEILCDCCPHAEVHFADSYAGHKPVNHIGEMTLHCGESAYPVEDRRVILA